MLNPTGLLKIIAALTPVMGNAEVGAQMAVEIRAMFEAMSRSAKALEAIAAACRDIDQRLTNIELAVKAAPTHRDIELLAHPDYTARVNEAVAMGETHNG